MEHRFSGNQILPHGSYLVNLGNPDKEKRKKSFHQFLSDLQICQHLGIDLFNFHPGSTVGRCERSESIKLIADSINEALSATKEVTCVIENMAGQANTIGRNFEELRGIIELVHDQARVGVCLDTCHLFAAGYDIRTPDQFENVMNDFERIVGFKFLKGVHLNDSKADLGSGKDRHESIGKGKIGVEAFRCIMNDSRFDGIPMVLETPNPDNWANEIRLLRSLVKE
jgi:apurinic endonuclease APN1